MMHGPALWRGRAPGRGRIGPPSGDPGDLGDRHEDADDQAEERGTLDEGGRDDHRGPDVTGSLGLTGRAFEGGGGETAFG